jgi:heat-inducible transcriptional repressor
MIVTVSTLSERHVAVLKTIVEDYVGGAGEPVGSKRVTEASDLGVSAATVRSDMATLEQHGLVSQPHPSAGRVPTDKGYRIFVDRLAESTPLGTEQRMALETLLLDSADLDDLLRRTSDVLSQLTHFASLVAAPRLDRSRLRHTELVAMGETSVLAVVILDTGGVEKQMLDLGVPIAEQEVQRARHVVNDAAVGMRLADAAEVLSGVAAGAPSELSPLIEGVGEAIRDDVVDAPAEELFFGGTANIVDSGWFDRFEQLQEIYEALEEQVVVVRTLREALEAGDPAVRIGTELRWVELAACSMVAARYDAGEVVGSLGVLGPMRMDYPKTLGTVQAVASSVGRALNQLTGAS